MLQRSPYSPYRGAGIAAALATAAPQPVAGAPANGGGQPQQGAGDRANASLAHTLALTLTRLEEIIDQETTALRGRGAIDLKGFNDRKMQALLDLSRLLKQVGNLKGDTALSKRLGEVQSKLEVNRAILKMHLEAVREISSTLATAIQDSESDGTYTPTISAVRRQ